VQCPPRLFIGISQLQRALERGPTLLLEPGGDKHVRLRGEKRREEERRGEKRREEERRGEKRREKVRR